MDYLWLKTLHIAAVVTWIGGLLVTGVTVTAFSASQTGAPGNSAVLDTVRRSDRRVTSPAMLLVWGLGLTLAFQGGWFAAPWLMLKLALVVLLSALHGLFSGTWRRLARADGSSLPSWLRYAPPMIVACVLAIVILVVIKPF